MMTGWDPTLDMYGYGDREWANFLIFLIAAFGLAWLLINGLTAKRPKSHWTRQRARDRRRSAI